MRRHLASVSLLASVLATGARADFVVAPHSTTAQPAATVVSIRPTPYTARQTSSAATASSILSSAARFRVAQGFGNHVPLRFAVRQIVPRAVRVSYGRGADPEAKVTWNGGEGWNRVLLRAVHPLGLRLVMTDMAVEIRK